VSSSHSSPFGEGLNHTEVLLIRDAVLAAYDKARTPEMSAADLRQLTQALIQAELVAESRRRAEQGVRSLTAGEEVVLAKAVDNQINGVGRLQALLDIPGVEDIYIRGNCPVQLRMEDGRILLTDPIADTPEELFAQIQFLAAYHGSRERAFSPANPILDMALPDGSRLAAACDVTPWPVVSIRRHPYVDITLDDLVRMGSITASMRRFLGACVRARRTIVLSGMPAAGKTVFLRALVRELDDYVRPRRWKPSLSSGCTPSRTGSRSWCPGRPGPGRWKATRTAARSGKSLWGTSSSQCCGTP